MSMTNFIPPVSHFAACSSCDKRNCSHRERNNPVQIRFAVPGFFELFLDLRVSFRMSGTRHQFTPAVAVEKPIDRAVIDLVPDLFFEGVLDLGHRGALSALSLCEEWSAERLLFLHDNEEWEWAIHVQLRGDARSFERGL